MSPKDDDVVEVGGPADTSPAAGVYEVEVNGVKTRMKLNATDAKRYGVTTAKTTKTPAKATAKKAATKKSG